MYASTPSLITTIHAAGQSSIGSPVVPVQRWQACCSHGRAGGNSRMSFLRPVSSIPL